MEVQLSALFGDYDDKYLNMSLNLLGKQNPLYSKIGFFFQLGEKKFEKIALIL